MYLDQIPQQAVSDEEEAFLRRNLRHTYTKKKRTEKKIAVDMRQKKEKIIF